MDPARPPPPPDLQFPARPPRDTSPPPQRPEIIQEASIVAETATYSGATHEEVRGSPSPPYTAPSREQLPVVPGRPGCVQTVAAGEKASAHIGIAVHQVAHPGANNEHPFAQSLYPGGHEQTSVSTEEDREESNTGRMKVGLGDWTLQLVIWALFVGTMISLYEYEKMKRENDGRWWDVNRQIIMRLTIFSSVLFMVWVCFYVTMLLVDQGARKFLRELDRERNVEQHMHQLCTTAPVVRFVASCYHFDLRTRTTTNSKGIVSTEARTTVPIVSHTASEEYPLAQWEDATMELPGMDSAMLTKLHLSKEYGFLTEVGKRRLLDAYSAFCAANRRDNFQSFKQELHIAGFKEEILCPRTANGVPWWVGSGVYWIASLLLFNVPYRQLLVWKTETVHHAIIKNIA